MEIFLKWTIIAHAIANVLMHCKFKTLQNMLRNSNQYMRMTVRPSTIPGGVFGSLLKTATPSPPWLHLRAIYLLYPLLVTYLLIKVFHYFLNVLYRKFPALSISRLHRLLRKRHPTTNSFKNDMKSM